MKKNVRFMLKIAIISALFIMVVAVRAFAAEVNMNNIDFTNIPETGTSGSNSTNNTTNTANTTNTSNTTNTANKTNTTNTTNKTNNTSTSSSSNTKMPATGSNLEIIFGVVAIVVVSGAIFFYRKQNIKLK